MLWMSVLVNVCVCVTYVAHVYVGRRLLCVRRCVYLVCAYARVEERKQAAAWNGRGAHIPAELVVVIGDEVGGKPQRVAIKVLVNAQSDKRAVTCVCVLRVRGRGGIH